MGGRLKSGTVAVEGLDDLRKELRKLANDGATQALKDANYAVAQLVVTEAQANASTRMESKAAASLRPSRQAARAQVTGGTGIEFFGGAEFGSIVHKQFKSWRGSGSGAGYFLYPAIRESTDRIVEMYGDAVEKISRDAFPD